MTSAVADFRVEDDLDRDGGSGTRYRATSPSRLGRPGTSVVVHVLDWVDDRSWEQLAPLLDAIHLVANLEERLADLIEVGYLDGQGAWCIAAAPTGATLAAGPVSRATALRAVAGAARATHALHEHGLVHRGVRPNAVGVDGTLGLPLLDRAVLGTGRVADIGDTADLDTLDPAVARGGRANRETDLFALGATLHQACTGRLLHPDLVTDQPVIALQRAAFEPVRLAADLPDDIGAVVAACTAPDPAERPPNALALGQHLELLAGRA